VSSRNPAALPAILVLSLLSLFGAVGVATPPVAAAAASGPPAGAAANDPFDLSLWDISADEYRVESFRGRDALWMHNGVAQLYDDTFVNGIIEFDIAVSDTQGFAGVRFRDDGAGNSEEFYIRSHLSEMPDASQYTPVFNGISGWQIYAGPRYNGPMEIIHDRWMHLKVVVSGGRAEVYLDSDEPVFVIPELVREVRAGHIALTASTAPARFANVQVHKLDDPPLHGGGADAEPVAATVVDTWSVSPPFAESLIEGRDELSAGDLPGGWLRLDTGTRGIANLARLAGVDGDVNTVVAAVTIDADEARTIPARFGFSDRVNVYLNGRRLFSANDGWRTRDYRYLGTIGLHDTVHLPLRRGRNDLWFAVSESFGGWGIVLDLPDREGLTVGTPE